MSDVAVKSPFRAKGVHNDDLPIFEFERGCREGECLETLKFFQTFQVNEFICAHDCHAHVGCDFVWAESVGWFQIEFAT
jgi:hypothetical protein